MAESNVYMVPDGANNNSALYAAMANGGMNSTMWNNPFAYLMLLPFLYGMTGNGWGNNNRGGMGIGQGLADVGLSNQIQNLSNQVTDNQNSNLTMGAINNVAGAVRDNGIAVNAGFDTINQGICNLASTVNAQGYQNQLANCQQTNTILQGNQGLQNSISNGFTQLGFQLERNACDVKETSTANTQKIVDTLNGHWNLNDQTTIQQLRNEIATLNQTQALIAALGGGAAQVKSTTT